MSQRDSGYLRKERDLYETPEWVTAALIPHLPRLPAAAWEPACGSGKMVRELRKHMVVFPSDIETDEAMRGDFLDPFWVGMVSPHSAIITNPPYDQGQEFCVRALEHMEKCQGLVAMLMRTDFDHAKGRTHLFRDCPAFAKKVVLMRRIAWFVEANGKPKASPSFNHAWYIWDWQHEGPPTLAYGP